ncbi:RNA polymerase I associated factor, A49-like protein [Syncephalis plumigaleata]|nr:RNA polymerase I associated factor, A49-like protein [Syncephalis plumigaleata]
MGKRKQPDSDSITCRVVEEKNGPVLVTTPTVAPSSDAEFHRYNNTTARRAHQSMIMCETDRVWFVGKNFGETQQTSLFCRYMIGVRDKRTDVLTLQPATVFPLEKSIKSLANAKSIASSDQDSYMAARNHLQETFGNKKQKAAVRARERNQVDVSQLEHVAGVIRETITERSTDIPDREDIMELQNESRPVPPFDLNAQRPEDIYPLKDVVSNAELNAVPLSKILNGAKTEQDYIKWLPFTASAYINERLPLAVQAKNQQQIRLLYYLACMFQFMRAIGPSAITLDTAKDKCASVPPSIVASLLTKFAENTQRENKKTGQTFYQKTDYAKHRLICYALVICLHLDQFTVLDLVLAHDFSMPRTKMDNYLRAIGCQIRPLTPAERERTGLPAAEASNARKAMLCVPLKFDDKIFRRSR